MASLKILKIGFDRRLRNVVSFNTATVWLTAAALAWIGDLGGSRCLAVVLTLLALYLRYGLSGESQR